VVDVAFELPVQVPPGHGERAAFCTVQAQDKYPSVSTRRTPTLPVPVRQVVEGYGIEVIDPPSYSAVTVVTP
jgi:hypothetical protein